MEELTLDGKKYLSSKKAAKITGYAKDYVGQLCREGRVDARQVGRSWYVSEESIRSHRFGAGSGTAEAPHDVPAQNDNDLRTERHSALDAYPATYTPETTAPIHAIVTKDTVIESHVSVHDVTTRLPQEHSVEPPHRGSAIGDQSISSMQEAWQSWFNDLSAAKNNADEQIDSEHVHNTANNIASSHNARREGGLGIQRHSRSPLQFNTAMSHATAEDRPQPFSGDGIHHVAYIPGAAAASGRRNMISDAQQSDAGRTRSQNRSRTVVPLVVNAVSILVAVALAAAVFYGLGSTPSGGLTSNNLVGAAVQFVSGTTFSHSK